MTGLLIFGLYLTAVAFATVMVGRALHQNDQEELGVDRAEDNRGMNFALGFCIAWMWPITLPALLGYYLLRGPARSLMRTPLDREHSARVELETLRKQARELGLPYPGEDR